eukprot:TRINITY_DN1235_c0_g2_i1.p1 TRINITY_DN1235_c0_g2~~TRINITY_DN1235_c0_g2_i1.p1  ORF type:complete len:214 (-),score=50.96 TRINITY_DN1235_c0_g2_i1:57-698(-)
MATEATTGCDSQTANKVKIGAYMLMNGDRPCKVMEAAKSKPGKHGTAKIRFVGLDIFTGKKYDHIASAGATVQVPTVTKIDWKLEEITESNKLKISRELRQGESKAATQNKDGEEPSSNEGQPDKSISKKEMRKLNKLKKAGMLNDEQQATLEDVGPAMISSDDVKVVTKEISMPPNEELVDKIKSAVDGGGSVYVTVISSMGKELVHAVRTK